MVGGDHISGDLLGLQDELVTWRSSAVGEIKISIRQVRAISRLDAPPGLNEDRKDDQVVLANRDTVSGIITAVADGKLTVQAGADLVPVPLDALTTVDCASTGPTAKAAANAFRVRFTADSSLTVAHAVTDSNT